MSSVKQSVIWDLATRQLLLPKLGHEPSECEDAIAVDTQNCRFAVADGATEAFDARNWAQRLAQNWVQNQSASTLEEFREWVAAEGRELRDSWNGLSLSWYSEEKARNGSFAALVGVELDLKTDEPSWKAIALGRYVPTALPAGNAVEEFASLPLRKFQQCSSAGGVRFVDARSVHEVSGDRFGQL